MKALTQYIRDLSISTMLTEASKPVKEFEAALGLKFPSKAKVKDGMLTFDMDEKKYKSWNGWYSNVFLNVYNRQAGNVTAKTVKDESELKWDFGADSPKGNEKWITSYTLNTANGDYTMIETQFRNHKTGKDTYYIAIKKA